MMLQPYERVNDIDFSLTEAESRARFGAPSREAVNEVALRELDYGEQVLRFQASGRLEEVTTRAPVLHLDALAVPFAALPGFVQAHDATVFRAGGFIVSPRFGIAFDPTDSNWVTALAIHCLPQWRALATAPRR